MKGKDQLEDPADSQCPGCRELEAELPTSKALDTVSPAGRPSEEH